jgi:hypothetical protein
MNNVTRLFFVGLFATLVFQFSPALAFHKPGHIPPTGTCREENCREEPPCDDKLLKELKAKRDLKIKTYREIVAAAEETRQREAEALAEAQKIFYDYAKGIAEKGVVTVGKEVFKVPDEIVAAYKEAQIHNSNKPASEKFLKLTKMYLETLFKDAGYKTAVTRAKWVDTAVSGALMDAMVLTKLKEAEFHAEQAFNQWLRGYEALMEARHLEDRIKKLEAECKKKSGPPPPPEQEADERSSGERELDEAKRMVETWKNVDGQIENAEGAILSYDDAINEALAIIQASESSWLDSEPRPYLVSASDEASLQEEWKRFRVPMIRAYQHLEKALDAYHRAEAAFKQVGTTK